jgi:hypothetical protein
MKRKMKITIDELNDAKWNYFMIGLGLATMIFGIASLAWPYIFNTPIINTPPEITCICAGEILG